MVHAPAKSTEKTLMNFTDDENRLYQKLFQESLRLDQERISFTYLQAYLETIGTEKTIRIEHEIKSTT